MHRTWRSGLLVSTAALLMCAAPAVALQQQIVLRQTPLGPMPTDMRELAISPDGSRVALVASAGSRQQVFVEGNEGPLYSTIAQLSSPGQGGPGLPLVMISPDLTRVAYAATKGPSDWVMVVNQKEGPVFERISFATFSPVGHRLAYIGTKGGKQYVVIDSTISAGYALVAASELRFSADGQHVGYTASTGAPKDPWRVVIDGKEGPGYVNVLRLQLSKTGGHVAYVAQPAHNVEENYVVVEDKMGPKFAAIQSITLSDDGTHVAYVGTKTSNPPKWMAVIDGQEGPEFDRVSDVVISPDGKHTAYAAWETGQRVSAYAIVDGKKSLDYVSCDRFVFSADSQHVAYVATAANQKSVVVLDGRESDAHKSIAPESLQFTADGKRLGYVASDEDGWRSVVDGKAGPVRRVIEAKSFAFSPDGQHYRFKTSVGSAWMVITDDAPTPAVDQLAPYEVVSSADGKHTATRMIKGFETSQQTEQVLLDGKPIGETYTRVEQLQISADGKHVAFIANYPVESEKKLTHAVLDGHDGPPFLRIEKLLLSPDGEHIAYAATEDGVKHYVVVDSVKGPEYEQVVLGLTQRLEAMQFRADGSLEFLAVLDGKLNRFVIGGDTIRSLPKPAESNAATSPGYSQLYVFGKVENDGAKPAVLVAAADGTLFGATTAGGEFQKGVLFRVTPDGSDYKILRSIEGGQGDGSYPSSIWVAPDGAIYGSMSGEGPSGYGVVYRAAADGSGYTILHAFTGNKDGGTPVLYAVDADGTLYGLSSRNRTPLHLFRMKPDGTDFKIVYDAPETPGTNDKGIGPFVDGGDGFFYGVAGLHVFKIKKDGSDYSIVRKFQGPPRDIQSADRAPILGADGMLYGIASSGGTTTGGVIYKLGRDGSGYALIVDPKNETLGPRALAEGSDGKLYALASQGLVRVNKDGSDFTVLQELNGGFFPWAALVRDGAFYGMTAEGAKGGFVFRFGIGGDSGGGGSSAPAVAFQPVPPTPLDSNVDLPPEPH